MTDLHQRLSDATEGTRELDALVWCALTPGAKMTDTSWAGVVMADGSKCFAEPVTTSLDAALALASRVLPRCRCMVERDFDDAGWAMVQRAPEYAKIMTNGNTPALALCLAILSAKATDTGVGG